MGDLLQDNRPETRDRAARVAAGPSGGRLVWSQVAYASRELWRTPVSLLITLVFPLLFLAVSGLAAGTTPGVAGDPAIQRLVPGAAVFAVAMSAFVMLAYAVALAGEQGVLKRLRGTPLPTWAYLAGRAGAAAWVAVAGTVLMVVVGMLAYGLQVTPVMVPALVLGLLVTIGSLAALGFAVAVLVRGAQAVMGITMGSVVLLGFVSDMYGFGGDMPGWLAAIGWALPLRHGVEVLALPLALDAQGSGVAVVSLLALLAWGAVAGVATTWAIQRGVEPGGRQAGARHAGRTGPFAVGSSGTLGLVWGQVRYANRTLWREPVFAGFALAMPTAFVAVLPLAVGNPEIDGVPFATSMITGMMVFGAALTAYVALPELVAVARDRGLLKRLRGTPLPAWAYLSGRIVSVFWVTTITVAIVLATGWLLYDTAPVATGWVPLVLVLGVGVASLSALGMAIAALVADANSVPAVTLATFLPLVFLSGIFPLGDTLPDIIPAITAWLPIAPMVDAVREAFSSGGLLLGEVAIMAAWTAIGTIVALARFRWE